MEKKRLPGMSRAEDTLSYQALAYIGDSYYELCVRGLFLERYQHDINNLHKKVVSYVRGESQSYALRIMKESFLKESEIDFIRRVRNQRFAGKTTVEREASGFEALIGKLYIEKKKDRLDEIVNMVFEVLDEKKQKEKIGKTV